MYVFMRIAYGVTAIAMQFNNTLHTSHSRHFLDRLPRVLHKKKRRDVVDFGQLHHAVKKGSVIGK